MFMKKTSLIVSAFLAALIIAILLIFMVLPLGQTDGNAVQGALDLRGLDLAGAIVRLAGEWKITPERLVAPPDFPGDAPVVGVPAVRVRSDDLHHTYATYRLTVLTDETRPLTLFVPDIYTAYKLWVNGEYVRGLGGYATGGSLNFENALVPVKAADGSVEIVIQAGNYHFMQPRMSNLLLLGENDAVYAWFLRTRILYILTLGFILSAAFHHVSLYTLRRRDGVYLLFSLSCVAGFWKFALDTNGMFGIMGWGSSGAVAGIRMYAMLFFLHAASVLIFNMYVFEREWTIKRRFWVAGYAVLGTAAYGILPLNVVQGPEMFLSSTFPFVFLTIYKAARSRTLRENKITCLYFAALILYLVVEGPGKYFFNHFFYMAGLIPNVCLIMVQSVILARQYADTTEHEQELAAKTAAMEQSARVRTRMIDTLSHEVRTPLTVMSTYAQIAVEQIIEGHIDEKTLSNLKNISGEAKRLSDLASNTLRLSRLSDSGDDAGLAPINVDELAGQLADLFTPMVNKSGRRLSFHSDGNIPPVLASANSLTRLLWNLLDNALNHSVYGDIEIKLKLVGDNICLTVKDHGVGIAPELLPRIFESGVSGKSGGTGIGLSICREIACEMGGTITLESQPGRGTEITLTLPVKRKGSGNDGERISFTR